MVLIDTLQDEVHSVEMVSGHQIHFQILRSDIQVTVYCSYLDRKWKLFDTTLEPPPPKPEDKDKEKEEEYDPDKAFDAMMKQFMEYRVNFETGKMVVLSLGQKKLAIDPELLEKPGHFELFFPMATRVESNTTE